MKKNILTIIIINLILLTGCTLGNTPTAKVEEQLSKYQMLDKSINTSYTNLTTESNLTKKQQKRYEELIKKQYQNSSYEIKDETIDGNTATVTIELEVLNYKDTINKFDINNYELTKYHDQILDSLEKNKEKITYTLDISLTKDNNDIWIINPLTTENQSKLLGIY